MGGTEAPGARVWWSVRVESEIELADSIGSFLLDGGAPGLQTEESNALAAVTAHFDSDAIAGRLDTFLDELGEFFPGSARPTLSIERIEESDWAENWKDHFPPQTIGARLYVHPPWIDETPSGRTAVVVDPGMAFGTGHHASTRGCLTALDSIVIADGGQRVLDLGTGSGVLAIAAIKLGAASALAVDIDREACAIAAANAAANRVADAIEVCRRLDAARVGFDIVVANIFSGMLIGFANDIARRLRPGGIAIGSGLETTEADGVAEAWTATGMEPAQSIHIDGWSTLVFRKAGTA